MYIYILYILYMYTFIHLSAWEKVYSCILDEKSEVGEVRTVSLYQLNNRISDEAKAAETHVNVAT